MCTFVQSLETMLVIQRLLYSISLFFYRLILHLLSPFVAKAKLMIIGRKNVFEKLEEALQGNTSPLVWFHAASLGEFEQARPVIEAYRKKHPQHKVLLTFFSPSGYEIKKDYAHADYVFYLPFDSQKNAQKFLTITKPKLAFFVKYEFWHYYINACKKQNVPVISFSTILRPNQHFFKWYGKFYRNILHNVSAFFVQNQETHDLLKSIDIESIIAGDTRCDRVLQIATEAEEFPLLQSFVGKEKVVIVGSAWPEDMEILIPFINKYSEYKYIIAPHEIDVNSINAERKTIRAKSALYSELTNNSDAKIVYIDCIGLLSKLYKYADVAYIGGAFGSGLHNVLEPATFGKPVLFGRKFQKFQEAKDLVKLDGAFSVENQQELEIELQHLLTDNVYWKRKSSICGDYVKNQAGASDKIIKYIETLL